MAVIKWIRCYLQAGKCRRRVDRESGTHSWCASSLVRRPDVFRSEVLRIYRAQDRPWLTSPRNLFRGRLCGTFSISSYTEQNLALQMFKTESSTQSYLLSFTKSLIHLSMWYFLNCSHTKVVSELRESVLGSPKVEAPSQKRRHLKQLAKAS